MVDKEESKEYMDRNKVMSLMIKSLYYSKKDNPMHAQLKRVMLPEYALYYGGQVDDSFIGKLEKDVALS